MAGQKPSAGSYDTFDSGKGVCTPDAEEVDGMDSSEALNNYCSNKADMDQGSVPEVPSVKR